MEVRVFKPPNRAGGTFEILGITELCEVVTYKTSFYEPGQFSLSVPWGGETAGIIGTMVVGNLILINKVFVGLIESVAATADESGRKLEVLGTDVLGLASRVLCISPSYLSGAGTLGIQALSGRAETLVKKLWRDNIVSPPQSWRKPVYGLALAPDLQRGDKLDYNAPPDCSVAETAYLLCKPSRLGLVYRQDLNNGQIVIDVREGVDRTGHQTANEPVIFAFDRNTLRNLTREQSSQASANMFLGASSKADVEKGAFVVSRTAGLDGWLRREKFLSVDVETQDNKNELITQVDLEGAAYGDTDLITIDVESDSLQAGREFEVGDFCTVLDKTFDIETDLQIVSAEVTASAGGTTQKLCVGMEKTTAYGVLRRMILNGR